MIYSCFCGASGVENTHENHRTLSAEEAATQGNAINPDSRVNVPVEYFADSVRGDDGAAGTEASPFRTVHRAVEAVRARGQGGVVTLSAGVFHMANTLMLSAADGGLVIRTNPKVAPALAWLSGAAPLGEGEFSFLSFLFGFSSFLFLISCSNFVLTVRTQ